MWQSLRNEYLLIFKNQAEETAYVDEIIKRYSLYSRDQFTVMCKVDQQYPSTIDAIMNKWDY